MLERAVVKLSGAIVLSELIYRTYRLLKYLRGTEKEEIFEVLFFPEDCMKTFRSSQYLGYKLLQAENQIAMPFMILTRFI